MIALLLFDVLMPTIFVAWLVLLVTMDFRTVRRGREQVERWAAAMSYQTQSVKRRWVPTGPWGYWYQGPASRVFEVVITEPSGETRTAFVRVSGGLFGLVADDFEWRWGPRRSSLLG